MKAVEETIAGRMARRAGIKSQFWRVARPVKRWIVLATRRPAVGAIDWGDLRRLEPVSRNFGFDRGTPVDRVYIERFMASWQSDVRGHVLEIGTREYTERFGGGAVERSELGHPDPSYESASLVVDLTRPETLEPERFDCIICTQTLQFIFDVETAIQSLARLLKPGGVLLLTGAGISQISRVDRQSTGDHWRFTMDSMRLLLCQAFPADDCVVGAYGNVLASVAFLHGIVAEELRDDELDVQDSEYPLLVTARAVKAR